MEKIELTADEIKVIKQQLMVKSRFGMLMIISKSISLR